jgi:hypothetical protein
VKGEEPLAIVEALIFANGLVLNGVLLDWGVVWAITSFEVLVVRIRFRC